MEWFEDKLKAQIGDRYELLDVLGRGGFGIVYKARQSSTGQLVAIKVLLTRRLSNERRAHSAMIRFRREMMLIGKLHHPHIVRLIDSGELEGGNLFMVLEYIEGESLASHLQSHGQLSPRAAVHLMQQVLDALHAAHQSGIIHRDLKPHNIMVTESGLRPSATVLDFGIASLVEQARGEDYQGITATDEVIGTPAYMAPEQLACQNIQPATDLYAWSLVLAECLIGRRVFEGASLLAVLQKQATSRFAILPPPLKGSALGALVERASSSDLSIRYASTEEVMQALSALPPSELPDHPLQLQEAEAGEDLTQKNTAKAPGLMSGAQSLSEAPSQNRTPPWPVITGVFVVLLVAGFFVTSLNDAFESGEPGPHPLPNTKEEAAPTDSRPQPLDADIAPRPDLSPATIDIPTSAKPTDPLLTTRLSRARVRLGLNEAERQALSERFGARYLITLDEDTGVWPADVNPWTRPAMDVMTHEVTWALWETHVEALPPASRCAGARPDGGADEQPAKSVTAIEAQQFCQHIGMSLPTSREWEGIARGPQGHPFPIEGELLQGHINQLGLQISSGELDWNHTPDGVFDMMGGVSEWVLCEENTLLYCQRGFGHRGGHSNDDPIWFSSALHGFLPQDFEPDCFRSQDIGFRCIHPLSPNEE